MTGLSPADWAVLLTLMLVLGACAGFLAGLLGIGGGIVLVPGLFYVFTHLGFDPDHMMHVAVGTSLAIIIPTGISSARAHNRRGAVNFDLVKQIGIGIVIGVGIGTVIADHVSGDGLQFFFASALFAVAGLMLIDPAK